jgi:hypothetical protein
MTMKVPENRDHFTKYSNLVKLHGLTITQSTLLGHTPGQMRGKLLADPYLNNVRTLRSWDGLSAHLRGKSQPFNNEGEESGIKRGMSMSEANCTMKHLAVYHFAKCEPVFVDDEDPSLKGDYPRRPEWD